VHYPHAILVDLTEYMDKEELKQMIKDDPDQVMVNARTYAMDATEQYGDGNVFDWRTEDDAGRWADKYPGRGVILGATEPERFLKELEDFRQAPFENAIGKFLWLEYDELGWYTQKELDANPALVKIQNIEPSKWGDELRYCAGKPKPSPKIDKDYLKQIWENTDRYNMDVYRLILCLKMVDGEYGTESNFYSIPDCCSKISPKTLRSVQKNTWRYALVFSDYHN